MRTLSSTDLPQKAAKQLAQAHIGFQHRRFLGADRGHVDGVGDSPGEQVVSHLFGHLKGDFLLRLHGRGAEMRRRHQVGRPEQHIVLGRFDRKHVNGGAGDMAAIEGRAQGFLDDQTAARAVDDAHAFFGFV